MCNICEKLSKKVTRTKKDSQKLFMLSLENQSSRSKQSLSIWFGFYQEKLKSFKTQPDRIWFGLGWFWAFVNWPKLNQTVYLYIYLFYFILHVQYSN